MRKLLQFTALGAISILSALFLVHCGDDSSPTGGGGGLITGDTAGVVLADHTSVSQFDNMLSGTFDQLASAYTIYYGHTSHGSQIMTGLNMLYNENSAYDPPTFYEISDDLGSTGDTTWVPLTRAWLTAHPEYNMVMWSWCGGVSYNNEAGIDAYLQAMTNLEAAYPNVVFVYMTGHLDGTGVDGNLYRGNNQIRDYCEANGKILFDFADIESYDPDGTYYPDETDACAWCSDWCALNDCETCGSCAHSHCFNCYIKGKAFWVMLAEIYAKQHE
ncbi:MAG: hypothetical protein R3F48_14525 [Candidatus Zixiibacteriota bacterium]